MNKSVQYNPDVLTCLANLSNDEVFTPPDIANMILDNLPEELWTSPDAKFLDPSTKSGVFLREIVKRLNKGLADQIPALDRRVDHILKNQVFGISITELTSLLSRRTVYCSKQANNKYSLASNSFNNEAGNIFFKNMEHTWSRGKCKFCGASEAVFSRGSDQESYAYNFLHFEENELEKFIDMKFDVIISNPPYQLKDGGTNASAVPIYQKFVQQAKQLNPRYLTMITPSRWFGGGRGLNDFREEMLNDTRIRKIVDYEQAGDCFPGVDIAGGVSYFLWERDNPGECEVTSISQGEITTSTRNLNEYKTFVRHSGAVPIIRKVTSQFKYFMNTQVSAGKPFGLRTYERPMKSGDIKLRWQKGEGAYQRDKLTAGHHIVDKWKVITGYVAYDHAGNPDKNGQRRVFSKIDILPPGTVCTETYLVIGAYDSEVEAKNLISYMKTKCFRFFVSQFMYSHHITKDTYAFVPILKMNESYDDEKLVKLFGLTSDEFSFIDSKIKVLE